RAQSARRSRFSIGCIIGSARSIGHSRVNGQRKRGAREGSPSILSQANGLLAARRQLEELAGLLATHVEGRGVREVGNLVPVLGDLLRGQTVAPEEDAFGFFHPCRGENAGARTKDHARRGLFR